MNLVMTTPAPASPEDRYHPELAHRRAPDHGDLIAPDLPAFDQLLEALVLPRPQSIQRFRAGDGKAAPVSGADRIAGLAQSTAQPMTMRIVKYSGHHRERLKARQALRPWSGCTGIARGIRSYLQNQNHRATSHWP